MVYIVFHIISLELYNIITSSLPTSINNNNNVTLKFIMILFHDFSDLKKPFTSIPYSVSVETDRNVELRCLPPDGVPPPRVYWMRNGVQIEPDNNMIVSSEGNLLIGQARLQDTANYTCVAENVAAKRQSDPALLTVYGKYFCLSICSKQKYHQKTKVLNF